jgi:uncharacterized protein YcaQ
MFDMMGQIDEVEVVVRAEYMFFFGESEYMFPVKRF